MKNKAQHILNDLERIITETNIDTSLLEYGATYIPNTDGVEYFIKLKNSDDYIINSATFDAYIPYDYRKALKRILKEIQIASPYSEHVNLNAIRIYNCPGAFLNLPCIYMDNYIENSNIIFFPTIEELTLIKRVRIIAGATNEEIELVYSKDVTPENFQAVLNELKELDKKPSKDLLTVVDVW